MELANPIFSVAQQRNFRKENITGALPPLLRNTEDLEGIILDLIYPYETCINFHIFFTLSEEFSVKNMAGQRRRSSQ
jgi:hypothetical protein